MLKVNVVFKLLTALFMLVVSSSSLNAATYSWTGANSGDWNDSGNWDANGVPIDTDLGDAKLDLDATSDKIVFNAPLSDNPVPTSNIPTLGGDAFANNTQNTPPIELLYGDISFFVTGWNGQGMVHDNGEAWGTTVGDGDIANGTATLGYSGFSQLNRDADGSMVWTIYADGAINIDSSSATMTFCYGTDRPAVFILNGGSLTIQDECDMLRGSTDYGPSYIQFSEDGSSFTAKFGTDFVDVAAVEARIGAGLTFRSTTGYDPVATDNGNGTFTVEFPPRGGTLFVFE